MIRKLYCIRGTGFDPYHNLAVEQVLLEGVEEGVCILYLWQNENTVVIGKNQNPWQECRTGLLQGEGGRLARRLSGGGAVFHDLGNLNFTFLMRQEAFSLDRQFGIIERAVSSFGVDVRRSGRNDILAEGMKFSGNAFYKNGTQAYHHGTLLVDADMEKLSRYLSPSKAKLQSKGVESVRSRVVNLHALNPQITVASLMDALEDSFAAAFGISPVQITEEGLDTEAVSSYAARNKSWDWLWGRKLPFDVCAEERFSWGSLSLSFRVETGIVTGVQAFSDAMDWTLPQRLEQAFLHCRFDAASLGKNIAGFAEEADIAQMLNRMEI